MSIFSKGIFQSIIGIFNINNKSIQINNEQYFENKHILDEYFEERFNKIEESLNVGEVDEVQKIINDIELKKQDRFSEEIEKKLLKYKGIIALNNNDFNLVNEILQLLLKYGNNGKEIQELKFNIAVFNKDESLFNELKNGWMNVLKKENVEENEAIFLYDIKKYSNLIESFRYSNNVNIKLLVAQAYSIIGDYDKAEEIFNDINETNIKVQFQYIIHKSRYIFHNICTFTDNEEAKQLNYFMKIIETIDLDKLNKFEYKQFYLIEIQILTLLDSNKALKVAENIISKFEDDFEIMIVFSDVLERNGKLDKAEEICEKFVLKNVDEQIIMRLLTIKHRLKKWKDIIYYYEKYESYLMDNNFLCRYIYGCALLESNDKQKIREIDYNNDKELSLLLQAKVYKDNFEICFKCLKIISEKVSKNDLILIDIAQIYEELEAYDEACSILSDGSRNKMEIYKKFIDIVIKNNLEVYYRKIVDIYNESYVNISNGFIEENVYWIHINEKNYRGAYTVAKKLYENKKSIHWLNEYLRMKVINNDVDNLANIVNQLENTNISKYLITSAEVYSKLNDFQRAEELCYKAYYNLENEDVEILSRISSIKFDNHKYNFDCQKENDRKVEIDDIVTLVDDTGEKTVVCLNREYYYQLGKYKFNVLHIRSSDELWISVLAKKVNDEFYVKNKKYIIQEILNKYLYMFSIAFKERVKVDKKYIKQLEISENDKELKVLKEELKSINEVNKNRINIYMKKNKKVEMGMPIYAIINDINKIDGVIDDLLYTKEFKFMGGVPNIVREKTKVTLTLVSTVILAKFNLLKDFINYYDVYVGGYLIREIEKILNEYTSSYTEKELSVYLIDDKLYRDEKDEKYKKIKIDFYRGILNEVNKVMILNRDIYENCELINVSEDYLKSSDIEGAEIAKEVQATLFVDDIFTENVFKAYYKNIKTSNIAGFLNSILFEDYKEYSKILEVLIKYKYSYVFDSVSLANIIIKFQINKHSDSNKFKKIIKLIIDNDINGYYKEILIYICLKLTFIYKLYSLYKDKIDIIVKCINNKC
ncbi:hypothetical protein ONV75_16305 [Clostridium sp. LQ25]|uniref:tetratricopeptide repeat protein n=1 Tax=Clostridium sp. LQ25 TaxID=2992805 RepID=UPI00225AADD5|nr:hypothetical protein [Clostridium sp. LQ25]UZT06143.1 hypothetical protein ONV75_16305 [Clostridium sp. LQ25]